MGMEDLFGGTSGMFKEISSEDLRRILSGDTGTLRKVMADATGTDPNYNCGQRDCPIHGRGGLFERLRGDDEGKLDAETLLSFDAETLEDFALAAVGGAHNLLVDDAAGKAQVMQTQAALWLRMADIRRNREAMRVVRGENGDRAAAPEPDRADDAASSVEEPSPLP